MSTSAVHNACVGEEAVAHKKLNLCLCISNEIEYSQTFIKEHIGRIPLNVKLLHGGSRNSQAGGLAKFLDREYFPNKTTSGRSLVGRTGKWLDIGFEHLFRMDAPPLWNRAFKRYLESENIDVVLAEFGWTGVKVMKACAQLRIPLVVHFHGADAYKGYWLQKFKEAYPVLFATADRIIAVSNDMVSKLLSLHTPREKIIFNPYGVDTSVFKGADPACAPPVFLAVGRFVAKKGPECTLRAFEHVFRDHNEARLIMIGDGELLPVCQQLAIRMGIEEAVSFPGVMAPARVVSAMQNARAFVQHSRVPANGDSEGTPLTILEAASAGLPVIATRHGGIIDVLIDGETSLLCDEGDVETMAENMKKVLESPALAADIGSRARAHIVAQYSVEESIGQLTRVLTDTANRNQK